MSLSNQIQKKVLELLDDSNQHTVAEMKLYLEGNGIVNYSEGQFAGSIMTLLRKNYIKKITRGIYIKNNNPNRNSPKICFIICPIGEIESDIRKNSDKLFKYVLKPVCESRGFYPIRVDQINESDSISQTIVEKLDSAELVIADITGHNPNVFYEMGYRKCTKKPIIHLKKVGETIPFDVNTIRTFEYDLTDLDSVEEIKKRLIETIDTFTFDEENYVSTNNSDETSLSKIIPTLYQIQDSIKELKEEVKRSDKETINKISEATIINALRDKQEETVLLNILIPEILKNPSMLDTLLKLSENQKNENKKES